MLSFENLTAIYATSTLPWKKVIKLSENIQKSVNNDKEKPQRRRPEKRGGLGVGIERAADRVTGLEDWGKTIMATPVQSLNQLDFVSRSPIGGLFPSLITWEDQVFYFLTLDRFSDGREKGYKDNQGNPVQSGTTSPYSPTDAENAVKTEAALGIDDIPDKLEYLVKGYRNPTDYFSLFRNSELVNKGSHIWFRNKVVTSFDDHDQVRKGNQKARFCADADASKVALNVLALNALTLGIPCIYYGSEQCFDGRGGSDRYIWESMFGGEFGAFGTRGRHFFNEDHPVDRELAKVLEIRRKNIVLRRDRQYLRPISAPDDGVRFSLPEMVGGQMRSVVPWSRIFNGKEELLAINTDYDQPKTAWVTIDDELHQAGDGLKCIYSTDVAQVGQSVTVEARNGKAVLLTVPAAGFVIFE